MITEDYCSFEAAKLLKEKGFEIDTNRDYWKIGEDGTMYFMSSIGAYTSNPNDEYAFYRPENSYPCPTHQMTMKWLREEHNIFIVIEPHAYDYINEKNSSYVFSLWQGDNCCENPLLKDFPSYEEAVEAALKYCLENLI